MADVETVKANPASGPQLTEKKELVISGRLGGAFNIDGVGFGYEPGSLTISERHIETTRWNDVSIKGQLPADLKPGKVEVKAPTGKVLQTGTWKG